MGLEKITQKLQEALQHGQSLASKSAHAELKSAHVLLALLQQEGGIATPILQKAGVDVAPLKAAVAAALSREPSVQGSTTQPQISVGLRSTLEAADRVRESLGDDYLSVEHFLLVKFFIKRSPVRIPKAAAFASSQARISTTLRPRIVVQLNCGLPLIFW